MHSLMKQVILDTTPRANKMILLGIAHEEMAHPEKRIEEIIRTAAEGFPPELTFDGVEVCTPEESAAFIRRVRANKSTVTVCRSDTVLVKIKILLNGVCMQHKFMHLLVVGKGGTFYLSGTERMVVATISDRAITGSAEAGEIFVKLLRDKIRCERIPHTVKVDLKPVPSLILHAKIHKTRAFAQRKGGIMTLVCHYMFAMLGFRKSMADIGVTDWIARDTETAIPEAIEGYTLFSTALDSERNPSLLYIRSDQVNAEVRCYACSYIYITDQDIGVTSDDIESNLTFLIALGGIIYKERKDDTSYIKEMMDQHMTSIAGHINMMTRNSFKAQARTEGGVFTPFKDVKEFTELLYLLIKNADEIITSSRDGMSNMYRKTLDVRYSIYFSFIKQVNFFTFAVNAKKKKKGGETLTEGEVLALMNSFFRTGEVYTMTKETRAVSQHVTSTDNYYLAGSGRAVFSTDITGPYDPELILHSSAVVMGTMSAPSKSNLRIATYLNCYAEIDESNSLKRNPAFKDDLDGLQKLIER